MVAATCQSHSRTGRFHGFPDWTDSGPFILLARPARGVFAKLVSDYLCSGPVVCFAMAVRTERNCILGNIGTAVGEPTHVVDLQEGDTVRLVKRCRLAAQLATTVSALENPALDLWIATDDSDFPLAARGGSNAFWRTAKRLEGIRPVLELVPVEDLVLGTAE